MWKLGTTKPSGDSAGRVLAIDEGGSTDDAIDVAALLQRHGQTIGSDFIGLLDGGTPAHDTLRRALDAGRFEDEDVVTGKLEWGAPIPRPRKIVLPVANNVDLNVVPDIADQTHWPRPQFLLKPSTAIVGPDDPIRIPHDVKKVNPEAEIALVIGQRVKNLTLDVANEAVFGYTLINDVTSASLSWEDGVTISLPGSTGTEKLRNRPSARAKGVDTFGPLGPLVVPTWELDSPDDVIVRTIINGDVVQAGRLGDQRFSLAELLVEITRHMTLEPGDIVATGAVFTMDGKPLRGMDLCQEDGGWVEIQADRIGGLRNPIVVERNA